MHVRMHRLYVCSYVRMYITWVVGIIMMLSTYFGLFPPTCVKVCSVLCTYACVHIQCMHAHATDIHIHIYTYIYKRQHANFDRLIHPSPCTGSQALSSSHGAGIATKQSHPRRHPRPSHIFSPTFMHISLHPHSCTYVSTHIQ